MFFQAPNHKGTRRSPCRRAPSSRPSTRVKSKRPSSRLDQLPADRNQQGVAAEGDRPGVDVLHMGQARAGGVVHLAGEEAERLLIHQETVRCAERSMRGEGHARVCSEGGTAFQVQPVSGGAAVATQHRHRQGTELHYLACRTIRQQLIQVPVMPTRCGGSARLARKRYSWAASSRRVTTTSAAAVASGCRPIRAPAQASRWRWKPF